MKERLTVLWVMLMILCNTSSAGTWTILDAPGAINTRFYGIDGDKIVGRYTDDSQYDHGLIYNGITLQTYDIPGATFTTITGIYRDQFVGYHSDALYPWYPRIFQGFISNGLNWEPLIVTNGTTMLHDIDDGNILGYGKSQSGYGFNFLYNNETGITVLEELELTHAYGIDGDNIVGCLLFNGGYIYDGITGTTFEAPGANATRAYGIDGDNIVGTADESGYLYDGTTWTMFQAPGAAWTCPQAIDGNKIVGYFIDESNAEHGFIYTIPEPATISLLAFGGFITIQRKKRHISVL